MPSPATLSRRHLLRSGLAGLAAAGAAMTTTSTRAAHAALAPIVLGAWSAGMDAQPTVLHATATRLGARMGIASIFRGKGDVWPYAGDVALARNRTLLVAWSLEDWGDFAWWASGKGDAVIRDQAARLKALGRPVVLRPWSEMNADWVAHQVRPAGVAKAPMGGTPAEFVAAWRRVVTIMRGSGVTNVRWAFCPTTDTYAETTDIRTFYPGSTYVDILGLDGYNWGNGGGLTWRTFTDVYRTQYARLTALGAGKPVWLCEVSSADPASTLGTCTVTAPTGASKGVWWRDTFAVLNTTFPAVQAVVLFDCAKERDWRAASSQSALDGLKAAIVANPRVLR